VRSIGWKTASVLISCAFSALAGARAQHVAADFDARLELPLFRHGPDRDADLSHAWTDGPITDERAAVSLVLTAASRRAALFETPDRLPQDGDRALTFGGEARIERPNGVALVPFFGWRVSDIEADACRALVSFASFCHDDPALSGRRFMLVVDEDLASSSWNTYAGFAMTFRSGVVADVAYKEFDGSRMHAYETPEALRGRLEEEAVVFTVTLPCGG